MLHLDLLLNGELFMISDKQAYYFLGFLWFSPVCVLRWHCNDDLWAKGFWHTMHSYDCSPVWVLKCLVILVFRANLLSHCSHLYGLSPVWVLKWVSKVHLWENLFWQMSHLYGLSPVWVLKCPCRWLLCVNDFVHILHLKGFFSFMNS